MSHLSETELNYWLVSIQAAVRSAKEQADKENYREAIYKLTDAITVNVQMISRFANEMKRQP